MQCPKCGFDHEDQTTECLKCGLVFAKYADRREIPTRVPARCEEEPEGPRTLQEARQELTCRLIALPLALVSARLLVGSPMGHLVRVFLSMWVHESGHAIAAWLCGFGAFPGPWVTPVSDGRLPLVTAGLASGVGLGAFRAWRAQRPYLAVGGAAVLVLQLFCTLQPVSKAQALIIFGGDAGCLVLGSLLMITFYARRDSAICRGGLRWGFLVIGAAAFMDAFATWWGARSDLDRIPFGENEGVGLSDPSRLTENYGWTVQAMTDRYAWLGIACLCLLAVVYTMGIMRTREAVRTMENKKS